MIKIRRRARERRNGKKNYLSVPASKEAEVIGRFVEGSFNISSAVGLTVKNLVQSRKKKATENQGSVIYKIPCGACDKSYIGETFRGKDTRTKEHKSDLRHHILSNLHDKKTFLSLCIGAYPLDAMSNN